MPGIADILGMVGDTAQIANQTVMPYMMDIRRRQEEEANANARAMVSAGAGILAGNKGNYGAAMPAIGAGIGQGQETYNAIRTLQATNAMKQAQLQMNALKARELSDYRRQQIQLGQQRESDLTDIRKERLADRRDEYAVRHEEKMQQLQQQKDAADERATNAQNTLEERYFRDRSMALQQEMNRENQKAIAQMHVDASAAGKQDQIIYNKDNKAFRWDRAKDQPIPITDPTTGQQMLGQPKGTGKGTSPADEFTKAWHTRVLAIKSTGETVPAEMASPGAWIASPEGKAVWDGIQQGAGTSDFNPKLPAGYSVKIVSSK